MNRLVIASAVATLSIALSSRADAQPRPTPSVVQLPAVGDTLHPNGAEGWPTFQWLYDVPSMSDAAGKIVVHWFCAPKVQACTDDLARITTLKENSSRIYVVAYINGTKGQAQKLDPIRESEGVGRGTLAYGKGVTTLFKKLGITGPASIIVDGEGKVAMVATGSSPAELDARDAKVNALITGIKDFTTVVEGPKGATIKPNEKFQLTMKIQLASWLVYSKRTAMEYKVMVPKDINCNATTLRGEQLKPVNQGLTASVTCSGPRGIYEVRGQITFGYEQPGGGTGIGTDGATWKFEIKP
ncbi:MAG TPA: hypothetical protein VFQ53_38335 [Kofleriaceae bacterium]|nr:hypothetical protein [Kofleriaceae bacterium]